jgi:hypothetical protein
VDFVVRPLRQGATGVTVPMIVQAKCAVPVRIQGALTRAVSILAPPVALSAIPLQPRRHVLVATTVLRMEYSWLPAHRTNRCEHKTRMRPAMASTAKRKSITVIAVVSGPVGPISGGVVAGERGNGGGVPSASAIPQKRSQGPSTEESMV